MNLTKKTLSNIVDAKVIQSSSQVKKQHLAVENISTKELTYGQRLADKLAAQVGSWGFLIGQSVILGLIKTIQISKFKTQNFSS